jgi:hypothetical protein
MNGSGSFKYAFAVVALDTIVVSGCFASESKIVNSTSEPGATGFAFHLPRALTKYRPGAAMDPCHQIILGRRGCTVGDFGPRTNRTGIPNVPAGLLLPRPSPSPQHIPGKDLPNVPEPLEKQFKQPGQDQIKPDEHGKSASPDSWGSDK